MYERAWAISAVVSIVFAGVAANTVLGYKFKIEALISYETAFILFVAGCCVVHFFM